MDMNARNQYLETLIKKQGYHFLSKKEKGKLLDEYCKNTNQKRKYVIRKIRNGNYLSSKPRQRKKYYSQDVKDNLIKLWEIFDNPCGQRLEVSIKDELNTLIEQKEIECFSSETKKKLLKISSATIDRILKPVKEEELLKRKYHKKIHPLLYQKIPVKLQGDQDRKRVGNTQIDFVEHCGQSAHGEYVYTLSLTDLASGWWEGEAQMGKSQRFTNDSLEIIKTRLPFSLEEIHSDNDSGIINHLIYDWTVKNNISFSRSRPGKKNDNCLVEQKNADCVRKYVGHQRYDTLKELDILNSLYRDLSLYKNFFQPQVKLISKERIASKIKRRYDKAKTPYKRLRESKDIEKKTKIELEKVKESLNPAKLKRRIEAKKDLLWEVYKKKNQTFNAKETKKLKPVSVTFLTIEPEEISVT